MDRIKTFLERWWGILVLVACLPFFYTMAAANEQSVNYLNNDFFTFWLSGHLIATGAQPYLSSDWVGGHHLNGATWIPNQIFPYPLPLAFLMVPLSLLSIKQAYILWGVLAQVLLTLTILWLATFWKKFSERIFAVILLIAVLFNSNIHLMLLTGTFSALFLVFLALALYLMAQKHDLLAGMALALMALKPTFLLIVILIGIWLLFRRNWKAIAGILIGGLALLGIGLLQDVHWVEKFRGASENLFSLRLGSQPTFIGYARLACTGNLSCALSIYLSIVLVLIGLYTWLVWKKRDSLTPLTVFSAAIALGVLLPPYIWSYDYALLIIPIAYICFELVRRTRSYLQATLFLLALDGLSFGMVTLFYMNPESPVLTIQRDMWSIWVAILVLVVSWWMIFRERVKPIESSI